MASFPGYTVRDYIFDAWHNMKDPEYELIVERYMNHPEIRHYIETKLEEYDEDTQSWRDYRNSMATAIDEIWPDVGQRIENFIKEYNDFLTKTDES